MAEPQLLRFDASSAVATSEVTTPEMDALWQRLEAAREELLQVDLELFKGDEAIPAEKQPLDAGFIEWPDKMLEAYESDRESSELNQILNAARRLSDRVDRVVVLGIGGSYMGARALMDACAQPYFNELTRADRGGKPRLYFAGNNVDNDQAQGLLHLLQQPATSSSSVEDRWGLVVISKSGGTLETAVAFRQFLQALQRQVDDPSRLGELVIPVTGREGKLARLADEIGCVDRFPVPDGIGGRFSVLTAVGLLPAAILGLDVVALLRGAWMMNANFASAGPGANPVMDYTAINHHLETTAARNIRVLSVWNDALESFGLWYDQLLAESLGKQGTGATPLTTVNTRDLHSRAQQHQEGRDDKVFNHVVVDQWRFDPLAIGELPWDHDQLNALAQTTLPELMSAAYEGTDQALSDDGRPTTTIHLPHANELALGQLFQMMMLATALEGRLLGINPYGQPGVEKYKNNMNRILKSRSQNSMGAAHAN